MLGAYPLTVNGIQPPAPGANGTAGSYCSLAAFSAYASPGASYYVPSTSPNQLTIQFSQQLNNLGADTNSTITAWQLV